MIKFSEATKKGGRVRYAVGAAFALATMAFLQTGMGKASFFAEPDRAMSNLGFSWRKNNVETSAPPVVGILARFKGNRPVSRPGGQFFEVGSGKSIACHPAGCVG
jgi:hypothetical protein